MNTRRFEVDLVKAVGIVAVVLIHSMRPFFDPAASAVELRIGDFTRFAVPGFLAVSGFLYASARPASAAVTRRRLERILLPYLVASAAAQLFWIGFEGREITPQTLFEQIALGSSFGPYYYVPIAALFVLLAPALARLGARPLTAVAGVALAAQWMCWALLVLPLFWTVRNPLYWLGFFLVGWWLGTREPAATHWLVSRRVPVSAASATGFATALLLEPSLSGLAAPATLRWLSVWCALGLLSTLGVGRAGEHRFVRHLSDSTYTIYLFHLVFVVPAQRLLPAAAGVFDPIAIGVAWLAGIAGPLALAAAGRALFGPRSRALLGS